MEVLEIPPCMALSPLTHYLVLLAAFLPPHNTHLPSENAHVIIGVKYLREQETTPNYVLFICDIMDC